MSAPGPDRGDLVTAAGRGERPRIVHVINSLNARGAEAQVVRLVDAGRDGPHEHVVLPLIGGGRLEEHVRAAGALAEPLGVGDPVALLTAAARLAHRLRTLRPDVVHGWLLQGNLAATIGAKLALLRVPVLWNIRWALYGMEDEGRRTKALMRLSGALSRQPVAIVYNSRVAVPQHVALGFPAGKARIIPNGFDVTRFQPDPIARQVLRSRLGIGPSTQVIGMLARYVPMKDHATSLRAAARVLATGSDVAFVYAGVDVDPSNEVLMRLGRELGIADRIHLLGEQTDPAQVYPAFDVYWMSSWARGIAEGFPNVVAEAMACGVPCVVTDVGDAAWIVGDTGVVTGSGDPGALADGVMGLLREGPDRLRLRGARARDRIEREFSVEPIARAYADLYREVLGARAARPTDG